MSGAYIVTSFDLGGNSRVVIHVVTEDLPLAEEMYARVEAQAAIDNDAQICSPTARVMVELSCIPKDVGLQQGATLFWGKHAVRRNIP